MSRGKYLGEFEQLVLLAVARLDEGAYGMSIRREIEARSGRHVAIGAVYATLERLLDKRYVRAQKGDAPCAPQPRRSIPIYPSTTSRR